MKQILSFDAESRISVLYAIRSLFMSDTKLTYETSLGKPGTLAVVPGILILLIASFILFVGFMDGGSSYGPPTALYVGMSGIPLGVFLVTAGYLYRIVRALEVSNQLDR